MDREEIFENVNNMCNILDCIFDNDLLDYCINCLINNDYACEENFEEYKENQ